MNAALLVMLSALDVQWLAPESCPAPNLTMTSSANGRAVVRVEQVSLATWRLELTFLEPFSATRSLELASCQDVRRAARALVSLGLSGAEAFQSTEVSPPPVVAAEPTPQPPPSTEPEKPAVAVLARVGGVVSVASPGVSPRVVAGFDVELGSFAVGLSARVGFPVELTGVRFWPTVGADAAACWAPRVGSFVFSACASAVVEWWQLEGLGVSDSRKVSAAWVALGPLLRAAFRPGRFEFGVSVAGRGAAVRPEARIDGTAVATPPLFSLEAGAFAGLRL